jgi:hypothetical protein
MTPQLDVAREIKITEKEKKDISRFIIYSCYTQIDRNMHVVI